MKNLRTLLVIAVTVFGFTANSFGQLTNNANQTASATVITALTIESITNLDFGSFSGKSTAASKVVMDAGGSRATSTADLVTTSNGTFGSFAINGESGSLVNITLPSNTDVKLSKIGSSSGVDMTVTDFTTDQTDVANVTLPVGVLTLQVGATLNVGVNQAADTYQGQYTLTVNYN